MPIQNQACVPLDFWAQMDFNAVSKRQKKTIINNEPFEAYDHTGVIRTLSASRDQLLISNLRSQTDMLVI